MIKEIKKAKAKQNNQNRMYGIDVQNPFLIPTQK
jgi:hypothetical protein